jgi:hypothetical protein
MDEDNFYVTLSSADDASYRLFPSNTVGTFVNKLPERKQLTTDWEVALKQISFPRTWRNVKRDMEFVLTAIDRMSAKRQVKCILKAGVYTSAEELFQELNKGFLDGCTKFIWKQKPSMELDKGRLLIKVGIAAMTVRNQTETKDFRIAPLFDTELSAILGLPYKYVYPHGYPHPSDKINTELLLLRRPIDANAQDGTFYAYLDCIKYSMVGSQHVPLLRQFDCASHSLFGISITQVFTDPYYIKLGKLDFDQLEVTVCDQEGEKIDFLYGDVVLVLHFRNGRRFLRDTVVE